MFYIFIISSTILLIEYIYFFITTKAVRVFTLKVAEALSFVTTLLTITLVIISFSATYIY